MLTHATARGMGKNVTGQRTEDRLARFNVWIEFELSATVRSIPVSMAPGCMYV